MNSNRGIIYFAIGMLCIGISIGMQVVGKNKKEQRLTAQIFAYNDSVKLERLKMRMLVRNINLITDNPVERAKLYSEKIDERQEINKRMYKYQWKIDSLNIVLKK